MDFFERTGKMAIGSRLRMLTDKITADAAQIYQLYEVEIKPKWFPVFFVLADGEAKTITGIAKEIGHTHPSVSNIVKEMKAKGLIREISDKTDKRRNVIVISAKGRKMADVLATQCNDVAAAIDCISARAHNDLWKAIEEWEDLLEEQSLFARVVAIKKERERRDVSIVPFEARYGEAFRRLNEEWITAHWDLEPHDIECLEHPQQSIIDTGGHILVALLKGEPVGVCALSKMHDSAYDYELTKLAVSPQAQGKGIGVMLCEAVIGKARDLGAKKMYLESNTLLKPAIHIYKKVGFKDIPVEKSLYERGNIHMELDLA